jgi:hypothetical protein
MTERLVEDPAAVRVLAQRVADQTSIPVAHVEKDFWVTEVLRGAVASATDNGLDVVFKGGTSLSKAFRLIQRFSEDVDLLVIIPAALGTGAADTKLKALVNGAAKATGLTAVPVADATSKGVKRGARFNFAAHDETTGLSAGVFLEIGSRGGAMPAATMDVRSLLAEHAPEQLEPFAEATSFQVRVLDPSRTLVEKLVLLHTAHSQRDPRNAIRTARHYYDVHQLLAVPDIIKSLNTIGVETLSRDVFTYSAAAGLPADPRPAGGFANSPAFTNSPHIGLARAQYERAVLDQLVWPNANRPTFETCLEVVRLASTSL